MIDFVNVTKTYDEEEGPVFEGFSEHIERGEFILVTGQSGSGKSTLIKMLLKETEPDEGSITVDGRLLSGISRNDIPDYRKSIGVVFQDFRLFDDYSVYGNLEVVLSMTGGSMRDAESRITHILRLMGIDHLHKRFPRELSGGEKQKVCMARAILNSPSVLLADEPTGNLDPSSSAEIFRLMELIHRQGTTIVMATHDLSTADRLATSSRRIDLDLRLKEVTGDGSR
ncbi:MAG: ATP-binding cassette domain-containing protein [Lachnospiraceae bacterium]|nr:ATP-binding cassette domain-containing protein [Lachnospiraceae bacterium]